MYGKLIINDIRKSKLITITITAFILIAAMLTSLAAALIINLFGAIDNMLIQAKTPHFLQMHSASTNTDTYVSITDTRADARADIWKVDMGRLEHFAETHENVEDFQILEYLNIDGAQIAIGSETLAWSVQDNGFSTQSANFDFLLDLNSDIIRPADGEIYVPIYYMRDGAAKAGDTVTVHGVPFTVAGLLRDSQMNAAMASSKRFIVNENDFEKIREFGIMEYLIEFRLKDASLASVFESEYLDAGLPANGPSITYSIIRLMNAITDGIMIAVLIVISMLVIVVAFLCIRFTLIAKIEEDYREIGVLKAVGLRVSHIRRLYMAKYGAIAGVACILGFVVSLPVSAPFMESIRLYMGESGRFFEGIVSGMLGAAAIFLVVMLYVNGVLRRFRGIQAAQAVRFGAPQEKSGAAKSLTLSGNKLLSSNVFLAVKDIISRRKLYTTMLTVLIISAFIINVPQNIYNTISSDSFMTYLGIGECDVFLGVSQTQTDDVLAMTEEMVAALEADPDVSNYTVLLCRMFEAQMEDGSMRRLRVELGDHTAFPITYSKGGAPQSNTEIALSALNADELGKSVGDEVVLLVGDEDMRLTVCGVYSDITNGGFTAKAAFETGAGEDVLWSSIPVIFADGATAEAKIMQYKELFPLARIASAGEHIGQTFGSTVDAVRIASRAAIVAAALLTVLVTLLFMKMLITKDRYSVAVLKSLGFSTSRIRVQYIMRSIIVLILGLVIGTVLANTLGEIVGAALISSFGASRFNFVVDPLFSYLLAPLLIALCVYGATFSSIKDIRRIKISEHIKET